MKNLKLIFSALAICLVSAFAASCSSDDDELSVSPYNIEYQNGKTYRQTFYLGPLALIASSDGGTAYSVFSICNRLYFERISSDPDVSEVIPPNELITESNQKNNALGRYKDYKYYVVADFQFRYNGSSTPSDLKRLTDWKLVVGKTEEYLFNGKVYERIVIMKDEGGN